MDRQLAEYVSYRGDRLFEGAIDVSWLIQDREKARLAARFYVFHGPAYHGVSQQDIGIGHGHRLVDTASFTLQVIRRCNRREDRPFTLAIAGYGTGKSHFATALTILLSEPSSEYAQNVLANLGIADTDLSYAIHHELAEMQAPALVVSLNGMGNFELAGEFTRQIMHFLHAAGIDAHALDALRPRFKTAANLVLRLTSEEGEELAGECSLTDISEVARRLQDHEEAIYSIAHTYLSKLGFSIKAIGDETVKDVIETVCREYVGEGKPFSRLVVFFDEFGRYAEFATVRSQIAGSGVLQQLFEGIQTNADKATFIGFIQFDLNTYVQRMGQEYRNEILRVSTRYQSAEKAYLSINLETLLVHLLEKKDNTGLNRYFDCETEQALSETCMRRLNAWFPQSSNHRLWSDPAEFHRIVRKGCWPLSPYAVWLLFHLAAAGQHLQQRSALSLLDEAFKLHRGDIIPGFDWQLHAAEIWSEALKTELLTAEEGGTSGSVTHAYANVIAKAGQHVAEDEVKLLRAIVLSSKLGLVTRDRSDAVEALAALSGMTIHVAQRSLMVLENEQNILAWDERFNQFEIISDTASRPQFLTFLRKRVSEKYDARGKAQLFLRRSRELCPDVLCDRTCDFAEQNRISTIMEWLFAAESANLDELPRILDEALGNWRHAMAVDQSRGTIIYCYVEPEKDLVHIQTQTAAILKNLARNEDLKTLPILVVFLHDDNGLVGQCIAELTVLSEDLSEQDKVRFGNLVGAHREKCQALLISSLEDLIKQRHNTAGVPIETSSQRLSVVCAAIFKDVYPKALPFPFDGFSTARGNAADTCHNLTLELIRGHLTYNDVMTKAVRDKNRANEVLKNCWQVFLKNGDVSQRPNDETVRAIFSAWEGALKDRGGFISFAELIQIACRPPFGANIASAGLLLGVYLCARQKVFTVKTGDIQLELSELGGEMLFRGKCLDLDKLKTLNLFPQIADEGSEWDSFLDEWESATERSYTEQIEYLERSIDLRIRVPSSKSRSYRISLLESKAKDARAKLKSFDEKINKAFDLIESSKDTGDLHRLTFGVVKLKEVLEQMQADQQCSKSDTEHYHQEVNLNCQRIIQIFDSWLPRQSPQGRTTKDASAFERFMRDTEVNLKKLGLVELAERVERHKLNAIREINTLAEAQNLVDNIDAWLTEHSVSRALLVVDLRNDVDIAKGYLNKVSEILKRIQATGLETAKCKLNEFIKEAKQHEKEFKGRFVRLLEAKFALDAIDERIQEVNDLERIFERCDCDIEELRTMRRALNFYKNAAVNLCNENVSEDGFAFLLKDLTENADAELSDDEPPWMPEKVMPILHKEALKKREEMGLRWITGMENELSRMGDGDIACASNLHSRLQKMPGYLTKTQQKTAKKLCDEVETHLNTLKVEWLLEKYRELDSNAQNTFLKAIGIEEGPRRKGTHL